jgi:hypothetical protein
MKRFLMRGYVHIHFKTRRNVMSNKIAVVAASLPLLLGAAGAFAGDFQTPTTERAQQTQTLLNRAAHVIYAKSTASDSISNLWVFPTGDEHTVFAQYIVTTKEASTNVPTSQVHLEILKLQGDRVVEEHDLTRITDDRTLNAQQINAGGHVGR